MHTICTKEWTKSNGENNWSESWQSKRFIHQVIPIIKSTHSFHQDGIWSIFMSKNRDRYRLSVV